MRLLSDMRVRAFLAVLVLVAGAVVFVIVGAVQDSEMERILESADAASEATRSEASVEPVALSRSTEQEAVKPALITVSDLVGTDVTFEQTQAGLQAYLDTLAQLYDVRVSVQQLDGDWSASVRADESSVAASTYKAFVAVFTLSLIQDGSLSYDTVLGGQTVSNCLTSMITVSDNDCAYVFLDNLGRQGMTDFFQERGYTTSLFAQDGSIQTTTADLVRLMTELDSGELLAEEQKDFLLGLMSEQVYREGIPAGPSGQVADKVGFLWAYLNDAGIVTTDSGRYALAVITDGASWQTIATITSDIEAIMYGQA